MASASTLLASNANFALEVQLRGLVMASAAFKGSPQIIQISYTATDQTGSHPKKLKPIEGVQRNTRTRPAAVHAGSTWGSVRNWMGPERALLAIHDEPDLLREMIEWQEWTFDEFVVPVIERYRPEIITWWEDFCYNHGMLISPDAFREFCAARYRHAAEVARDCRVEWLVVDTDGNVGEYLPLLEEVGFNGCVPMEQVCGNDLLACRRRHPKMVFAGGIEKMVATSGSGRRIEAEILPKVPQMLAAGGYFPGFDHGLPPHTGFEEMCRAMTLLHRICGSEHLGEFPRM